MSEPAEDHVELWGTLQMRKRLITWLDAETDGSGPLADWLSGRSLPPVGDADAPYVWILRGVPLGGGRYAYERRLAHRVALLLREVPHLDEQQVYNLLMLCAGLSSPDELHRPLAELVAGGGVAGRWEGISLADALRGAVIENQIDRQYEQAWLAMLQGRPDPVLRGSAFDGFTGISLMPANRDDRGALSHYAVSEAVVRLARFLDSSPNRERQLQEWLARLPLCADRPIWASTLMLTMARSELPVWASTVIPDSAPMVGTAGTPESTQGAFLGVCRDHLDAWPSYVGALLPVANDEPACEDTARLLVSMVSIDRLIEGLDEVPAHHWKSACELLGRVLTVDFVPTTAEETAVTGSSFGAKVAITCGAERSIAVPPSPRTTKWLYRLALHRATSDMPTTNRVMRIMASTW